MTAVLNVIRPAGLRILSANGTSNGNGADTTEDTLMSYTIPANTLNTNGQVLRIRAGGTFAASTDTKTARVKFGGSAVSTVIGNQAGQTYWWTEPVVIRTGASAQSYGSGGQTINIASGGGIATGTLTKDDTSDIALLVTGQNSTNSVANSITCQILVVELLS